MKIEDIRKEWKIMKKKIVLSLLATLTILDGCKIMLAKHAYTDPLTASSIDTDRIIYAEKEEDIITLYFEDGSSYCLKQLKEGKYREENH